MVCVCLLDSVLILGGVLYSIVYLLFLFSPRAALEAQEKVESLESEIEEVHQRVGGFYYPNEIQAEVLGMLPKGVNFR